MECRTCGYNLWNISGRTCPECGVPFRPSEYEFGPNQVEFACAHCSQAYFGTSPQGHLEPHTFDCVKCGRHVSMDEDMILRPLGPDAVASRKGPPIPWHRREEIGSVRAFWQTLVMGFVRPREIMHGTGRQDPQGFSFYATLTIVVTVIGLVVGFGMASAMGYLSAASGAVTGGFLLASLAVGAVFGLTVGVLISVLIAWIWSAIIHGLLKISGGTTEPLSRTTQAVLYTAGPTTLQIIPWIGGITGFIWWIVNASRAVAEGHRCSIGRAAACVAIPPALYLGTCFGIGVLLLGVPIGMGAFGGFGGGGMFGGGGFGGGMGGGTASVFVSDARLSQDTSAVFTAMRTYARENDGYGPRHGAILLLETESVPASAFDQDNKHSIGGQLTGSAATLPDAWQSNTLQSVLDRHEAMGTPIHRVGQMVFAHAGIDLIDPETSRDLWVVINIPPFLSDIHGMDLDTAEAWLLEDETFHVVGVDGTPKAIAADRFAEALREQNELRRSLELPEIGNPFEMPADH